MELLFDHSFGKQEKQDLVICRPYCLADRDEEPHLLNTGWLALDTPMKPHAEVWYQSRSTRVQISKNKPRFKEHTIDGKRLNMMHIKPKTPDDTMWTGMHEIYKDYIKRKGFRDMYSPFQQIQPRDSFLVYYLGDRPNKLIGFTKIKQYYHEEQDMTGPLLFPDQEEGDMITYSVGVESVMHCNTIPISQITMDMEIQWAREQKTAYFYMGSGYENGSQYKAHWPGFQWWTGTEWSTNKRKYLKLCKTDSELKLISDLAN